MEITSKHTDDLNIFYKCKNEIVDYRPTTQYKHHLVHACAELAVASTHTQRGTKRKTGVGMTSKQTGRHNDRQTDRQIERHGAASTIFIEASLYFCDMILDAVVSLYQTNT